MSEPIDLEKLEALAKAATPGPWTFKCTGGVHMDGTSDGFLIEGAHNGTRYPRIARNAGPGRTRGEDAEFIAALDPATVLALVARARRADELQARMAVMDRLYAVARDVAIDMGDWPIDVTFGESGRDWIKRLDGARTDVELYDAQSPARARERAYLSTIAPSPDPTTWKEP